MLTPPGLVTFEVALIGPLFTVVHEIHVLNPTLLTYHKHEPDSRQDVHDHEKLKGHHEDFEVNFDALGHI